MKIDTHAHIFLKKLNTVANEDISLIMTLVLKIIKQI